MHADRHTYAHFSKVAEVYSEVRTTDAAPVLYLRDRLADACAVHAADLGCGDGRYSLVLKKHLPDLHLLCVDMNADMLARLEQRVAEERLRDVRTLQSTVEALELARASLDCITTFNAVHHFDVPAFLCKTCAALRSNGQLFVYTRTPAQNARTVWGRHFPGFAEIETRLHSEAQMTAWVGAAEGLRLAHVEIFPHARTSSLARLCEQAASRHYSTFSLYADEAFAAALEGFEANIRRAFPDPERVSWQDENTLYHVVREEG